MKCAHSRILAKDASGVRAPYTVTSPLWAGPKWKVESIRSLKSVEPNVLPLSRERRQDAWTGRGNWRASAAAACSTACGRQPSAGQEAKVTANHRQLSRGQRTQPRTSTIAGAT